MKKKNECNWGGNGKKVGEDIPLCRLPLNSTIEGKEWTLFLEEKGSKNGKDALLVTLGPVRTADVLATKKQLQFYL